MGDHSQQFMIMQHCLIPKARNIIVDIFNGINLECIVVARATRQICYAIFCESMVLTL